MPLYEYSCQECGNQFEKMVRLGQSSDGIAVAQAPVCPQCGSVQTHKQISNFGARIGGQSSSAAAPASSCSSGSSRFR